MALSVIDIAEFDKVYKILDSSFPKAEKRTYEGQRALMDNPHYHIAVRRQGGEILSFIAYWQLDCGCFIEHFATSEAVRGKGIGLQFLREFVGEMKSAVLEVEPPETSEMAVRRIAFYNRAGFVINDFPYFQPSMQPGQPEIPLKIMSAPTHITEEEFKLLRSRLYKVVYQRQPKNLQP